MNTKLLNAVTTYMNTHAVSDGVLETPIPGLLLVRETAPTSLMHSVARPLVCFVLQGAKTVATGQDLLSFGAGEALIIASDIPTIGQVTKASVDQPYFALVIELDLGVISDLAIELSVVATSNLLPIHVEPTSDQVTDATHRLLSLLDRPSAQAILQTQYLRELHYWLMTGPLSGAIVRLIWSDPHARNISRAIALLRSDFAKPLPVEYLAKVAGMSASSFYQHFRAATLVSPLQFQKQLRLIEARRLMLSEGSTASQAGFAVGYESVPQFTRDYARMFGAPPARETQAARAGASLAA
jgi:AraC-like DNA-binding protein